MSAAVSRAETKRKATEHGVKPFVGALASQRSGESWRTQGGAGAEGTACRQFFAPDGDWDVPVGYREKWRLPCADSCAAGAGVAAGVVVAAGAAPSWAWACTGTAARNASTTMGVKRVVNKDAKRMV